ncbi:MAG: NRDE family protein [Pirellulales bacterium]|nr:NRDE family protein [Pirellulales bacterium]
MCTVTVLPFRFGARVVCNRDELRSRAIAQPPAMHVVVGRRTAFPRDPDSGGTWIAITDAGLCLVLLNVNDQACASQGSAPPSRSRGTIVPGVCRAASLDEAVARASALDFPKFAPFRLLLIDRSRYAECAWNGTGMQIRYPALLDGPLMYTSSSLGDSLVEAPRRAWFDSCFCSAANWRRRQIEFHLTAWPGDEARSVWMTRADALTVSQTTVDLGAAKLRMAYRKRRGDSSQLWPSRRATLSIARTSRHVVC